ncbi:coiled-coil-helix-coiled-coil-helix domain-containing protein 10, mitochondrial-like [Vigna unguiculata]|uniref:coiled-coil-helix-coiled-coil-helix domain-containing protein 10, mitochondrial-like n=1 Tax=Vigna unguiculata TaxID=3917 RepID=UPI001015D011|nr:coiled-coil-helix-coiled-coil-helix domain-containing protein 10, mitochondrial-like [Vigna unguiculata]
MPRRSGGSDRSAPRPAPRTVNPAPPPAPAQNGNSGSLLGTVAEGMAFGGGVAVVNRALDSALGPRIIQHETVATGSSTVPAATANSFGSDACNLHLKAFHDCLNSYGSDISKCQFYMDSLAQCRRNSGATLSS